MQGGYGGGGEPREEDDRPASLDCRSHVGRSQSLECRSQNEDGRIQSLGMSSSYNLLNINAKY